MSTILKYAALFLALVCSACQAQTTGRKPNVLIVVADDQSFPHASAYGNKMVSTPGFDLIAGQGALFTNAYVTSPGCSPSRASILTGLYPWQLEEAGSHASSFSSKYICFPDLLQQAGYHIGYTGKGWGPGDWKVSGRKHNPAGPEYNSQTVAPPYSGISKTDYTANFKKFLSERSKDQPFYFWIGTQEPHRPYENKSWVKKGYSLSQATVPGFLPDNDTIKSDLLDYAAEIAWSDSHLMNCINELKRIGEFDNTIIIVTADNGMSFPYAKANCTDAGIHVPLAICWGNKISHRQVIETLVSTIDIAPTVLAATGLKPAASLGGQSLLPLLTGNAAAYKVEAVYAGRERHSFSRYNNMGYPMRSIRWENYLLIHNFHPERWPAGDPIEITKDGNTGDAFYDIDEAPSKQFLVNHRSEPAIAPFFQLAMGKRPEFEFYNLSNDSNCLHNLVGDASYAAMVQSLKQKLNDKLVATKDTRIGDNPEIWETYPRLEGKMRDFKKDN